MANPNLPLPLPGEDPNQGEPGLTPPVAAYTKEEAAYRAAEDSARSCSNCAHFIRKAQQSMGQGMCDLVAGPISPNGVSDMFTPKGGPSGVEDLLIEGY